MILLQDFHGDIRGFKPTSLTGSNYHLVQSVTRKQLTKSLGKRSIWLIIVLFTHRIKVTKNLTDKIIQWTATVTEPLSEEATYALSIVIGDSEGESYSSQNTTNHS